MIYSPLIIIFTYTCLFFRDDWRCVVGYGAFRSRDRLFVRCSALLGHLTSGLNLAKATDLSCSKKFLICDRPCSIRLRCD